MKPNILIIESHDTGRYVSPYGYAVDTPNIQRLAEQGVLFRNAFSAAPTCSASRAALLSGSSPHGCGILGLTHRGFPMNPQKHLAGFLKKQGYATHVRGVYHETKDPRQCGYDTFIRHTESDSVGPGSPGSLAETLLGFGLREPFFMYVGFANTHRPFPELTEEDRPDYVSPPAHFPDLPEIRQDWAGFLKCAKRLDAGVGLVMESLESSGFSDRTIVILTTDHGVAFPRMKCNLTDAGIGTMLMIRGPESLSGGQVCDGLVSQLDIFPTICDLIDVKKPDWLEGHSLVPLLQNQTEVNEEVFAEVTFHASYEPQRCVRTKRYKYIRRFGDRETLVRPNIDNSLTKTALLDMGFGAFEQAREQLFDLTLDPQEFRNLAGDPAFQSVLDEMRGRLDSWMTRTNDPLLKGEVPLPDGAQITDPNEYDPVGKLIINRGVNPL